MGQGGNRSQIAPEIPQLFANSLPEFLPPWLSGFGHAQIGSSGVLPIGAGLWLGSGAAGVQVINELFGLLTGVIQEIQISGVLDIGRHTGGINVVVQ